MSDQQIRSIQGDTMDAIAHRYYTGDSVAMLPLLLANNRSLCDVVIIPENTLVTIPAQPTQQVQRQTLSLWD